MATLLANTVWEGVSTEDRPTYAQGARDGHFFKELDTGESYIRVNGTFEYVNLGLAFVKATKSGRVTTDGNGEASISFNTPFINDEYSIALSCADPGGPPAGAVIAYKHTRTASGFTIQTRTTNNQPIGSIEVSWLCTRVYNPQE